MTQPSASKTVQLEVLQEPHVAEGTVTGLRAHGKLLSESKDVVHVLTFATGNGEHDLHNKDIDH